MPDADAPGSKGAGSGLVQFLHRLQVLGIEQATRGAQGLGLRQGEAVIGQHDIAERDGHGLGLARSQPHMQIEAERVFRRPADPQKRQVDGPRADIHLFQRVGQDDGRLGQPHGESTVGSCRTD